MPCDNNVKKGNEAVLLVRNDANTAWEVIGGIKSRDNTMDNPVEDITSSSTPGDSTESQYTGYSTDSMSISGVADNRTGATVTIGGTAYTVAAASRMDKLANTGNRCALCKIVYPYKEKQGDYNITSYGDSGDTPGLLNFTATLQNKSLITTTYY
jgi:hypothetical protein